MTGNPHAMPAIALPRRLDIGPFVKSSTSLAAFSHEGQAE
jgi:hypothetical protein